MLGSDRFVGEPAFVGHRPGVFHSFRAEEDVQVRGVPNITPGMKLFRHLHDSLGYGQSRANMETAQADSAVSSILFNVDCPEGVRPWPTG